MDNIEGNDLNGNLLIRLSGKIDSLNAASVREEVVKLRRAHPDGNIIADAEKLEYISSAGLRVILKILQENPETKIINVSSAVYEILEITGFTELIPVEKASRRLSVEGCRAIGQGAS
jgi:anti-anti-sigma factor